MGKLKIRKRERSDKNNKIYKLQHIGKESYKGQKNKITIKIIRITKEIQRDRKTVGNL